MYKSTEYLNKITPIQTLQKNIISSLQLIVNKNIVQIKKYENIIKNIEDLFKIIQKNLVEH